MAQTIRVFVNRRPIDFETEQVTGEELLTKAGFGGRDHDLLQLQGEGDPTGGTLIMYNQIIPLKPGLHFRAIPGNRTFGVRQMQGIDVLRAHAKELEERTGVTVELTPEGTRIYVILRKVPLPPGLFQVNQTDVLFLTDTQYPSSAMDMFWTDPAVVRRDGSVPQGAEQLETYLDRQWRRFSWHRNGAWNRLGNGLLDHFAFMESRWDREAGR